MYYYLIDFDDCTIKTENLGLILNLLKDENRNLFKPKAIVIIGSTHEDESEKEICKLLWEGSEFEGICPPITNSTELTRVSFMMLRAETFKGWS